MPTYQWQGGWGGSMLSPASLRASSHLGTDTAPQLQLGWGMQCAASSKRCPPGLKWCGGIVATPRAEGDPLPSPHPVAGPGGAVLGTFAPAVAGIQLCLGLGAGAWR